VSGCRSQPNRPSGLGHAAGAKHRALQDCVLFLQAQKLGFTVLTGNIRDYDCLLQLIPAGRALFYRRV
jgi:hypothetical protein